MKLNISKKSILKALTVALLAGSTASCAESFLDVESKTEPNSNSSSSR